MTPLLALDARVEKLSVSATIAARLRSSELVASGRRVYKMGLGQSPFPVPTPVVAALRAAAEEKDYLPPGGLPALRSAIADYHRRRHALEIATEDVIVGPGSKELMFLLQLCFDGDILIPTPSWVSYGPQAQLAGRSLVRLPGGGRGGLMLDPEDLDRSCGAAKRPRLLFLNSPSNPTGLSYTPDELTVLAAVCRRHGVVVLSDEIYGDLAFSGDHRSIARAYPEGTIVASGLSKWCGAGGWRLGTLGLPPTLRPLRRALEAVASETFTSTSAPIQHAAVAAFRPSAEIEHYLEVARRVLSIATTWAASRLRLCDVDVQEPAGGFYLYVGFASKRTELARAGIEDDRALLERALTDTGVVSVAGSAFGSDPRDLYLRLALVDFDGARALRRAASSVLDVEFLQQVLRPLWDGINALAEWIDRGFRRPS